MKKLHMNLIVVGVIIACAVLGYELYAGWRPFMFEVTGNDNLLRITPCSVAITSTNYLTVQHIAVGVDNVQDLAGWQVYIVYNTNTEFQSATVPLANIFHGQHNQLAYVRPEAGSALLLECDRGGYDPPGASGSGYLVDISFTLTGPVGSTAQWWIGLDHPQWTTYMIHSDGSTITPLNYDTTQAVIMPEYQPALLIAVFAVCAVGVVVLKRKKVI
jgi:hypothetical protein